MKKLLKQIFCKHTNLAIFESFLINIFEGFLIKEHIFCKDCHKCLTDKKARREARIKLGIK